jgi:hypothetical protein
LSGFEVFRLAQSEPSVGKDGRHVADFFVPSSFVGQLALCPSVAIPSRLILVARVAQILQLLNNFNVFKKIELQFETYSDPVERLDKDVMQEPH